jgi:hypothetical protein
LRCAALNHCARRALALGVLLGAVMLGACESQRQLIAQKEDRLSAVGFIIKPANTPERRTMLKELPANKFLPRQSGDTIHYVYADPIVCGCLYVGTQQAYDQYKSNEFAQRLAVAFDEARWVTGRE